MADAQSEINNSQRPKKSPLAQKEEEILQFWKDKQIFKKALEKASPQGEFVFYEGPPTANGKPGIHHLESRAFKDIIPRYKTMKGYLVRRKAGWDTHGLPVELEVEKQLGLKSKKEIEKYGIAKFNKKCRENVWTYVDLWKQFTERIGFWLDLDNPYITYETEYIESVWSILRQISGRDLLYKDYKVLPWCPRCGTALSSHELAQGYETVKDISVYVKFKLNEAKDEYFLAWTTTPWTLLGNLALAVGEEIQYVKVEIDGEKIWMAEKRQHFIAPEGKILEKVKGKKLVGKEYKPLYPFLSDSLSTDERKKIKNAHRVYPAEFANDKEGSGIVHTAVMYGQDDFVLGSKYNLPKHHLVDETGHFKKETEKFSGMFVKEEETSVEIIRELTNRNLLLKKEKYEHSYPFCWRCNTPLIYYARSSWYIRISDLRKTLVAENKKIHWEPEHIKSGRFGEWLFEVKDWAISRERYWGTPLPIWVSDDGKEVEVLGSLDELRKKIGFRNKYYVMRHGHSDKNQEKITSSDNSIPSHITQEGKKESAEASKKLKKEKIDFIFTSPLIRAVETAKEMSSKLGLSDEKIIVDERLKEIGTGEYNGKPVADYHKHFNSYLEYFSNKPRGGESLTDVKKRVSQFFYEIDSKHEGKNILVISHEYPIWMVFSSIFGWSNEKAIEEKKRAGEDIVLTGEVREIPFVQMPHGDDFEIDLHKPFIDEITFKSKSGKEMRRVPEVLDVWFDSGAMPFAQDHHIFGLTQNKTSKSKSPLFPADYVSEAIDQTRGWFYTLHAIGVLLKKGLAFKNVICLGHILDEKGQKMSKSKGNVVDPWDAFEKYGVDSLRFWMYSVNQPGESKNFDEKTVNEVVKKIFNLLENVLLFYEMYARGGEQKKAKSKHVMDKWINVLLLKLNLHVSKALEEYKPFDAAREIKEFIADLSQWYVRRSRDRFKSEDESEVGEAISTLGYILVELSKIMAPFTPFFSEDIYRRVTKGTRMESVHLENWPKTEVGADESIIEDMNNVREISSLAHEARSREGIRVRQPLKSLSVKRESIAKNKDLIKVLLEEVNIKEIIFNNFQEEKIILDTHIDSDLKEEGDARELIRLIQEERKNLRLTPKDVVKISIQTTKEGEKVINRFEGEIKKVCNLKKINISLIDVSNEENLFGIKIFK